MPALREQLPALVERLGVASIVEYDVLFSKTEGAKLIPGPVGWHRGNGRPLDGNVCSFISSFPHIG